MVRWLDRHNTASSLNLTGCLTFSSPHSGDQVQKDEMGREYSACVRHERCYRVLVGRPVGKRLYVRPRRRWQDNIKIDLREGGLGGMDWYDLVQDGDRWLAFVNAVMDPGVP